MAGEASLLLVALRARDEKKFERMLSVQKACEKAEIPVPDEVAVYLKSARGGWRGETLVSWYDYRKRVYSKIMEPTSEHGKNPECTRYSLRELLEAGFDSIEFRAGGDY